MAGKRKTLTVKCVECQAKACYRRGGEGCPIPGLKEALPKVLTLYRKPETMRVLRAAARVERDGYLKWPRIREVAEFARSLGASKIGVAFCIGLSGEAERLCSLLEQWGFQVESVCCKCGGVNKSELGLDGFKLSSRSFEAACNPILQAELLNRAGCQLNVVVGLCVGHDSLFYRYSKAPVTTLVVKDRVTGHNPLAALYSRYHERLLTPEERRS